MEKLSAFLLASPLFIGAVYIQASLWRACTDRIFGERFESLHRLTWVPLLVFVLITTGLVLLSFVLPKGLSEALFALSTLAIPAAASWFVPTESGSPMSFVHSFVGWLVAFIAISLVGAVVAFVLV